MTNIFSLIQDSSSAFGGTDTNQIAIIGGAAGGVVLVVIIIIIMVVVFMRRKHKANDKHEQGKYNYI